jgi:hypothetical protein
MMAKVDSPTLPGKPYVTAIVRVSDDPTGTFLKHHAVRDE